MPILENFVGGPFGVFVSGVGALSGGGLPEGTRLDIGGRAQGRGLIPGPGQTILTPGGVAPVIGGVPTPIPGLPGVPPPGSVPPGPSIDPGLLPLPILPPPGATPPGLGDRGLGLTQVVFALGSSAGSIAARVAAQIDAEKIARVGKLLGDVALREGREMLERMGSIEGRRKAAAEAFERSIRFGKVIIGVGRGVVGIGGALYPSSVATGVPTPEEIQRMERLAQAPEPTLTPVQVLRSRLPVGTGPVGLEKIKITAKRLPQIAPSTRSVTAPGQGTPQKAAQQRTRGILSRLPIQQILISAVIGELGSSRTRSRASSSPSSSVAPLTSVSPQVLTSGAGVPYFPGQVGTARCECPPKKKRTSRKCLERGQVQWRSGRYKGKVAGSKCIRFAEK